MLFMLNVVYTMPPHFTPTQADDLRRREIEHAAHLVDQGVLVRIWRVVGTQSNYSLWRADTLEQLHAELGKLPMFPYLRIDVTPLVEHPLASRCTASV